jgi:leucyl/phenylalanyl-tRNA--protein transferase
MRKVLATTTVRITSDQAFGAVVAACAAPRDGADGTWITPGMQQAYQQLHELAYAHSVEVWNGKQLVGGLYGVAMGKVFFGESMFSRISNASKIAFIHLVRALAAAGYQLIDCQVANPHLASLGAIGIPRAEFMHYLPGGDEVPKPPHWPLQ